MFFLATALAKNDSEYIITYETDSECFTKKSARMVRTIEEYKELLEYLQTEYPFYILSLPIEKLFEKISTKDGSKSYSHDMVIESIGMVKFLESEFKYKKITKDKPRPFFKKSPHEIDPFFTQSKNDLVVLYQRLDNLGRENQKVYKSENKVQSSLQLLGVQHRLKPIEFRNVINSCVISLLKDINWILKALDFRVENMNEYEQICIKVGKKISQMDALNRSKNINQEKVNQYLEELQILKIEEQKRKALFNSITLILKSEIQDWFAYKDLVLVQLFDRYVYESCVVCDI